jgi:hypothetical protein
MQATAPNAAYALENTHLSQKTRLVCIMDTSTKIVKIVFSTNTNLFSTSITGLSAASGLISIRCLPGTYYQSEWLVTMPAMLESKINTCIDMVNLQRTNDEIFF